MGYIGVITYNPLTNLLLTSWDILVGAVPLDPLRMDTFLGTDLSPPLGVDNSSYNMV